MKIIIWMVIPCIIVYVFWITYKAFNHVAPEEGSQEDSNIREDEFNNKTNNYV